MCVVLFFFSRRLQAWKSDFIAMKHQVYFWIQTKRNIKEYWNWITKEKPATRSKYYEEWKKNQQNVVMYIIEICNQNKWNICTEWIKLIVKNYYYNYFSFTVILEQNVTHISIQTIRFCFIDFSPCVYYSCRRWNTRTSNFFYNFFFPRYLTEQCCFFLQLCYFFRLPISYTYLLEYPFSL